MKKLQLFVLLAFFALPFQPALAETHWLDFNPYSFTTEFFRENNVTRGSCGAAAVVLVENNLNLLARTPANSVLNKNNQMRQDPNPAMRPTLSGMYYISSIDGIGTRLQRDGYGVTWLGSSNRKIAAKNIYDALARKRWVIIVARHGFNNHELGHFYPIYGGNLVMTNGVINESASSLNAIDDFYGMRLTFDPQNPVWNDAYKRGVNLKQVLDSMISASSVGMYNIIEVYKH